MILQESVYQINESPFNILLSFNKVGVALSSARVPAQFGEISCVKGRRRVTVVMTESFGISSPHRDLSSIPHFGDG